MTRLLIIILFACTAQRTIAQSYDWTIENSERVFGKDQATPNTTRNSTIHINTTIENVSDGVIRVTINSLDMIIPDTPIGDITFDSDADPDPENVLEPVLRPLVALSFTLTYDNMERVLNPSRELLDQRGTSALGQSMSPPYLTAPFAPFFMFQEQATPDAPRSFMLVPHASGVDMGDPTLIDYIISESNDALYTEAELTADVQGSMPGIASPAKLKISGSSQSKHNPKSFELEELTYELTSVLSFEYRPTQPVRSELVSKITIKRKTEPTPTGS